MNFFCDNDKEMSANPVNSRLSSLKTKTPSNSRFSLPAVQPPRASPKALARSISEDAFGSFSNDRRGLDRPRSRPVQANFAFGTLENGFSGICRYRNVLWRCNLSDHFHTEFIDQELLDFIRDLKRQRKKYNKLRHRYINDGSRNLRQEVYLHIHEPVSRSNESSPAVPSLATTPENSLRVEEDTSFDCTSYTTDAQLLLDEPMNIMAIIEEDELSNREHAPVKLRHLSGARDQSFVSAMLNEDDDKSDISDSIDPNVMIVDVIDDEFSEHLATQSQTPSGAPVGFTKFNLVDDIFDSPSVLTLGEDSEFLTDTPPVVSITISDREKHSDRDMLIETPIHISSPPSESPPDPSSHHLPTQDATASYNSGVFGFTAIANDCNIESKLASVINSIPTASFNCGVFGFSLIPNESSPDQGTASFNSGIFGFAPIPNLSNGRKHSAATVPYSSLQSFEMNLDAGTASFNSGIFGYAPVTKAPKPIELNLDPGTASFNSGIFGFAPISKAPEPTIFISQDDVGDTLPTEKSFKKRAPETPKTSNEALSFLAESSLESQSEEPSRNGALFLEAMESEPMNGGGDISYMPSDGLTMMDSFSENWLSHMQNESLEPVVFEKRDPTSPCRKQRSRATPLFPTQSITLEDIPAFSDPLTAHLKKHESPPLIPRTLLSLASNEYHPVVNLGLSEREHVSSPSESRVFITMDSAAAQKEKKADKDLWLLIMKDVERTLQKRAEFQDLKIKYLLANILFIWAKENQTIGYQQGMNELVAMIIVALSHDCDQVQSISDDQDPFELKNLLRPVYLEHDVYTLFDLMIQKISGFYEPDNTVQLQPWRGGLLQDLHNDTITKKLFHIHHRLLRYLDLTLYNHLRSLQIHPQHYLFRWIRLLLCREFETLTALTVWDRIFFCSEGDRELFLLDFFCVAIIILKRDQIMELSDMTVVQLLQNQEGQLKDITVEQLVETATELQEKWMDGPKHEYSEKELTTFRVEANGEFSATPNDSWPNEDLSVTNDHGVRSMALKKVYIHGMKPVGPEESDHIKWCLFSHYGPHFVPKNDSILREGYLVKRGGGKSVFGRRSFKRRWTVISNGKLAYFKNKNKTTPQREWIPLPGRTVTVVSPEHFAFTLSGTTSELRSILFFAQNEKEFLLWLHALTLSCEHVEFYT